jgi:beta-galactosidase
VSREVRVDFDDSRWKPAFSAPTTDTRIYRGSFTRKGLPKDAQLRLLLRHFGASAVVYLNGQKLATSTMTTLDEPLPAVELGPGLLREGRNVLAVIATPYANERARERALKVPPAVLRVETAPPPYRRRLFNGLAQVIVQSTGEPGPVRLIATAPGVTRAELTLTAALRSGD